MTFLVALPFLLPGWIPLTDLPEHAAAMASIAHAGAGPGDAWRIDEHYFVAWSTSQYLLVHLAGAALIKLGASAELACRVLLVTLAVAWVRTSRRLLVAFGADPRLAAMSALLFWNRAVIVGFLPYLASLPLLFATFAHAIEGEGERSRARVAALAIAGVVVFYTHASAFTLLFAFVVAHEIGRARKEPKPWLVVARRLLWLLPATALAAVWLARGQFAMRSASIHDASEIETMNPLRALWLIATYAHDIWPSHVDDWVGIGFWLLFFVFLGASLRRREERIPLANVTPLIVALTVYLATPFRVGTGLLLNVRMAPVLACFALLGLRGKVRRPWPLFAAVALAVVQCVDNVAHFRERKTDVAGLRELLAQIPEGSRLITLNFSGYDRAASHFTTWLHVGSYHRAMHGGVASFSFSELPHWSVQYRPERAPPRQATLSFGMRPCLYRNARDGEYFDYVLVRGGLDPFEEHPPGPRWSIVGRTAKYTLYAKDATQPSILASESEIDEGPCAKAIARP